VDKQELVRRILELDSIVTSLYPHMTFDCVIVGGGALLIKDIITRGTLDVDVLEVSKEVEELFVGFDFNTRVKAVLDCFPYNYEDRLELVELHTVSIHYYTPSIEDLIVSKLYAYRDKDIEDLKKIKDSNQYNKELLDKVIIEAKESAVTDRRYKEMVHLYNNFFKE
jgi:hypothetical protein